MPVEMEYRSARDYWRNKYMKVKEELERCRIELELEFLFPEVEPGKFRAICLYNGVIAPACPNNEHGLCKTVHFSRPRDLYHPWDGKNCWKCNCG